MLITPPTYGMYKVCAAINDVKVKKVPLTSQFDLNLPATLAALDANTKMLFLCSPGNPTSRVIPNSVVESVLQNFTWGLVVVDEAYIDFSSTESACSLVQKYPNVVVLQTLSKAFGLAGIRLGMAVAQKPVIQLMNNMKAPYNINKLTINVVERALSDLTVYRANVKVLDHYSPAKHVSISDNVQHIRFLRNHSHYFSDLNFICDYYHYCQRKTLLKERDTLVGELKKISAVEKIYPSDCNFVLFRIAHAKDLYKLMADRGVVCRYLYIAFLHLIWYFTVHLHLDLSQV